MEDKVSYGWQGKILRINLTSGQTSLVSTEPYKTFIGGMGIGNKIMYDEVPATVEPLDPESKIVYAVGPITASGVPLGGRSTFTHLSTYTKDHLVVESHTGGMLGAQLKFAGYDGLIIEGVSPKKCYIRINDDEVTIEDATDLWGVGIRETTEILLEKHGTRYCVGAIGEAGENLLPYSCLINSRNHSAGAGLGAIFGSKNCKGLCITGTKAVHVADPQEVMDLSDYMIDEVVGSNNNHVVPSTQQEWAEYYDAGSRWTARKGLFWGAAGGDEPVETGECGSRMPNSVGFRCMKAAKDLAPTAEQYTVKMDGCFSCPIHCFSDLHVPKAGEFESGYTTTGNTCVPQIQSLLVQGILGVEFDRAKGENVLFDLAICNIIDDKGIWCNYAQIYRDICYCYVSGIFERVLEPEIFASVDWDSFQKKDPTGMLQCLALIAKNDSEIKYIGYGPIVWCERWDAMDWFDNPASTLINYRGWPVHHAIETFGQVGGLYNMMFNRDDMIHSAVNFLGCGLPYEIKQEIAGEVWGDPSAIDPPMDYSPMNKYKAKFAWWSIVTDILHDSLTVCNWVWPMTMSPTKDRDYRGDLDLEAKFMNAVTGGDYTTEELYKTGAAIMTLQRANTVRGMGSYDLRNEHDVITEWAFTIDPDIEPFNEGTKKMERDDFQLALTLLYREFGWDETYGCPTRECLEDYGLASVADDLEKLNLLP